MQSNLILSEHSKNAISSEKPAISRALFLAEPTGRMLELSSLVPIKMNDSDLAISIVGINSGSFIPFSVGVLKDTVFIVQIEHIKSLFIGDDFNKPNCSIKKEFGHIDGDAEIKRFLTARTNLSWYQLTSLQGRIVALLPEVESLNVELHALKACSKNLLIKQETFYGFSIG